MTNKVLVTGGAGFIGSHTVDGLVKNGYKVRVFDNLDPQVHGEYRIRPKYLNKKAELVIGDMRNKRELKNALKGVEIIFHLAAAVGVGQSMYEIYKYMEVNTLGTANLLELIVNEKHKIKKLIVASSMSIYGEGGYICKDCSMVYPKLRSLRQLSNKEWEMKCPKCGKEVKPTSTGEDKPLYPTSIYAISKRDQEEMCLNIGRAYEIPTAALRYFNVYGPRQALSNPYTGVAAIFSSRILNGYSPLIFEDGYQSRDFIHVSDIVQANLLALKKNEANYGVFNVGTGRRTTILDIAYILSEKLNFKQRPKIINKFREGDIRHCYANISKIQRRLGFSPKVKLEEGIVDLINWVRQQSSVDIVEKATRKLAQRGLIK